MHYVHAKESERSFNVAEYSRDADISPAGTQCNALGLCAIKKSKPGGHVIQALAYECMIALTPA